MKIRIFDFGEDGKKVKGILIYCQRSQPVKNNQLTKSERKLAVLLIRYMQKNPDAKHTAEGIARWWIMQQKFEEEIERVEKVLRYLTKRGVLQEIILPQNQTYYKINNQSLIHFIKEIEEEYI